MDLALEKQIHTAIQKSKVVSIGFTIELGQNNLIYSDVLIWKNKGGFHLHFFAFTFVYQFNSIIIV